MHNGWRITTTWKFRTGWTEIVLEAKMGAMSCVLENMMASVFTSMRTKHAVCMKPSPTSARHFHGGMKIWFRPELGTKPYNFALVCVNPKPM
jgi:hypothetical protein